jgi:hypothetical protein
VRKKHTERSAHPPPALRDAEVEKAAGVLVFFEAPSSQRSMLFTAGWPRTSSIGRRDGVWRQHMASESAARSAGSSAMVARTIETALAGGASTAL